jgi:CheY-like chemotaxis protein
MKRAMTPVRPLIVSIDDASSSRLFFDRIAASMDVEPVAFPSAAAAMPLLSERKPALIFLDIIMPGKDGLTFLQELRAMPMHHDTAVVIVTSKDYAQDRATAKSLGVMDYLIKPLTTRTLREAIVKVTVGAPVTP